MTSPQNQPHSFFLTGGEKLKLGRILIRVIEVNVNRSANGPNVEQNDSSLQFTCEDI